MSNDTTTAKTLLAGNVVPPRPCAFYQADMATPSKAHRDGAEKTGNNAGSLRHRCMLHPGKATGPDGNALGVSECTLPRQALCQAQRRQAFSRLYATVPTLQRTGSMPVVVG